MTRRTLGYGGQQTGGDQGQSRPPQQMGPPKGPGMPAPMPPEQLNPQQPGAPINPMNMQAYTGLLQRRKLGGL